MTNLVVHCYCDTPEDFRLELLLWLNKQCRDAKERAKEARQLKDKALWENRGAAFAQAAEFIDELKLLPKNERPPL